MEQCARWLDKNKMLLTVSGGLLVVVFSVMGYRMGIFTDQAKMQAFLLQFGILAPLIFVFVQAVQVVIPILPGAVGCLYGVILFGNVQGFLLNYIGICIGSVMAFLIARNCGQQFVENMTGGKFYSRYSRYLLKENQFEKLFALLIFLPVAPDDMLCYLAGISRMELKKFTMIILLGKPAAIMMYSLGLNKIFQTVIGVMA